MAKIAGRKKIDCRKCGAEMEVGGEAVSGVCWHCTSLPSASGVTVAEGKRPASRRLKAFVLAECCNFDRRTSECLFVWLQDENARCRVCSGDRCGWFERAVLPTAELRPQAYGQAAKDYISVARRWGYSETSGRVCGDCGVDIDHKKLFCPECLERRRRDQYRREKQRQRKQG